MPDYDEQELQAGAIDRMIWALGMNQITPKMIDTWLVEEFGQHLVELGGLRGFAEHFLYGRTLHDRFLQWRGGSFPMDGQTLTLLTREEIEAHNKAFADRLAACLRHHGLTMEQAAKRLEQRMGRSVDTFDLRNISRFEEDFSACQHLVDLLDVKPRWLFLDEGDPPEWYNDET